MRVENIPIQNIPMMETKSPVDIHDFIGILEGLIFTEDKEIKDEAVSLKEEEEEVKNLIGVEDEKEDTGEVLGFFYPGGLEFKTRQTDFEGQDQDLGRIQDNPELAETINLKDVETIPSEIPSLQVSEEERLDLNSIDFKPLEFEQVLSEESDSYMEGFPVDEENPNGLAEKDSSETMRQNIPEELREEVGGYKEISKTSNERQVASDLDFEANLGIDLINSKDISEEKTGSFLEEGPENKEIQVGKEDPISSPEKVKEKPRNPKFEDMLINPGSSKVKEAWLDRPLGPDLEDLGLENIHRLTDRIIDSIKITSLEAGNLMEVQLYPEELGSLNIKLRLEDGKITGKILVENQLVKSLLVNSLSQLNQNLAKGNINLEKLEIDINTGLNGNLAEKDFGGNQDQKNFGQSLRHVFSRDSIKSLGIGTSGSLLDQSFGSSSVNILV